MASTSPLPEFAFLLLLLLLVLSRPLSHTAAHVALEDHVEEEKLCDFSWRRETLVSATARSSPRTAPFMS